MTQLLDNIVQLQHASDQLRDAEGKLHGIPEWMQELHTEHAGYQAEIDTLQAAADEAASARRAAEGEIEEIQTRLKRYQEQINQVTTQREYGALLQEIDTAKSTIAELEKKGIESMELRESSESELETKRADFKDLDERYAAELAKWEAEKPSVASRIEDLKGQIDTLRNNIPRGYLAQYDRIASRYEGEALAPVVRLDRGRGAHMWHCGACHYNARPQVVVEVGRGASLLSCESCKRILYLPAEEPDEAED